MRQICLQRRKKNRLPEYDYSSVGAYFITICVKERKNLLGEIKTTVDSHHIHTEQEIAQVELSDIGNIVEKYIKRISGLDKYVIMPNHIHMVIIISGEENEGKTYSISQHVLTLKTLIAKEVGSSLFQRSFHDHIIRNEQEYERIWDYIDQNPQNWALDRFYQK